MTTLAEKLYNAYASAVDVRLMSWADLNADRERGRAWFLLANMVDEIRKPPETIAPYDYVLQVPIEPRLLNDVMQHADGSPASADPNALYPEHLPTALRIRPMVARDLFQHEYAESVGAFNTAVLAAIHGVSVDMLGERVDIGDADAAEVLAFEAKGKDAWQMLRDAFVIAGGSVYAAETKAGANGKREPVTLDPMDRGPWEAVAFAMLSTEKTRGAHEYIELLCRSPGIERLTIGPLRTKHIHAHEDAAVDMPEWEARVEALALATKTPAEKLGDMRIEDIDRLWSCFELLKKKAAERTRSAVTAQLFSRSTAGAGQTSDT